jgi:hypothetical protein
MMCHTAVNSIEIKESFKNSDKFNMLSFHIILILSISLNAANASVISKNCVNKNLNETPVEFKNYVTESQRRADPNAYVQAMDALISKGPFKSLLECRDKLKSDNEFDYRLHFLEPSEGTTMSVSRTRPMSGMQSTLMIQLSVNLKSSPQKVFFIYIHELTHVCQAHRWAKLHTNYDLIEALPQSFTNGAGMMAAHPDCPQDSKSSSQIKADYYRHRKFGEVEGFYTMTKAYQHYTELDPSFCHGGKEDKNQNLFEGYLEMEKMIDQGYFSQDIILKYHEDDKNKEEVAPALYNQNSPSLLYPDGVSRPKLNEEMIKLIKDAGMPVIEPL